MIYFQNNLCKIYNHNHLFRSNFVTEATFNLSMNGAKIAEVSLTLSKVTPQVRVSLSPFGKACLPVGRGDTGGF